MIDRAVASKDPTWQAKGLESRGIQGARLTHLIGDDVTTPVSAQSAAARRLAVEVWDMQATTRILPGGQALCLSNFNDARDLPSTLSGRPGWAVLRRPSLHVPGDRGTAPDDPRDPEAVEGLPERWPRERLMAELHERPMRFRRLHLLDARGEQGERLLLEWLSEAPDPPATAKFYIGLDPAPGGEGHDPDFFGLCVGARHGEHLDVVASLALRVSVPDQIDALAAVVRRYQGLCRGVAAIGCPKTALDRYFRGAVESTYPQLAAMMIDIPQAGPKEERLEALGPYARSGFLRVHPVALRARTAHERDRHQELTFEEEWQGFPGAPHDDRLDAAWTCVQTAWAMPYAGEPERVVQIG